MYIAWNWEKPPVCDTSLVHGICDVCIYRRDQLFRMYTQTKRGTCRYLREFDTTSLRAKKLCAPVIQLPACTEDRVSRYGMRYKCVPSADDMCGTRATVFRFVPEEGLVVCQTITQDLRDFEHSREGRENGSVVVRRCVILNWVERHKFLRSGVRHNDYPLPYQAPTALQQSSPNQTSRNEASRKGLPQ